MTGLASVAQAARFQRDVIDLEAGFGGAGLDFRHIGDGDFLALTAAFAQQEAGCMLVIMGIAGHEGVEALDTVDQAHLLQKAERAIDGRRLGRTLRMEAIDDIIGLDRRIGRQDQLIGAQARRRHALAGFNAQGLRFLKPDRAGVGLQVMVVIVGVFATVAHGP